MTKSIASGFSLVEVLLTMVILAIGVIGISVIELAVLRKAQQSARQEHALRLAGEAGDLLMALRRSGAPGLAALSDLDQRVTPAAAAAAFPGPACAVAACDAAAMASVELAALLDRMALKLPAARLRICFDRSPWNAAARSYVWECSASATASVAENAPLAVKIGWSETSSGAGNDGTAIQDSPRVVVSLHGEAR